LPTPDKGRTGDKTARVTGISRRTLEKAEAVVTAAEAEPEKYGALREQMDRSGRVDGAYRRLTGKDNRNDIGPDSAHFEVAAELKTLIVTKAPGWTGAIAETQAELNAAEKRFRDDGARGHWLIVAPRERLVVDHRVIQWLLLTTPAPPAVTHIEWAFALCDAADKARCPAWVSERLTGKSRPQRPGMTLPRELPIPRQTPRDNIGADSRAEAERLRVRVEELQADKHRLELKVTGLEREIEELRGKFAATGASTTGDMSSSEFQAAIKKWEDTVEVQRGIIAKLESELASLRAGVAAPPADPRDPGPMPAFLVRSAS
jgi:hypothetical protein